MGYKFIGLLEGSFIEQQVYAFARRQLALLVLPLPPFRAPALFRQPVAPRQLIQSAIVHPVGLYGSGKVPQSCWQDPRLPKEKAEIAMFFRNRTARADARTFKNFIARCEGLRAV